MPDYNELLNLIKQASNEANEASKPVNVCFGKVLSASPLQIVVDQKMTLGSAQLVLSRNVTDFKTEVTVDWTSESSLGTHSHSVNITSAKGGDPEHDHSVSGSSGGKNLAHTHKIEGRKEITVHNSLKQADEVILLRMQEGQKYIVLDRIGG